MSEIIDKTAQILKSHQIDNAKLEARLIVGNVLGIEEQDLFFDCPALSKEQEQKIKEIIDQRIRHIPLCKILGTKGFYKYDFIVNENVLSPRPDTEILVEAAISHAKAKKCRNILDLGTGSGCIIISILSDIKDMQGTGLDISEKALEIAQKNAQKMGVSDRLKLIHGSWFDSDITEKLEKKYDMIVSNPPYIATKDIENLSEEVKGHDPLSALDGGEDGLRHYRRIAKVAKDLLQDGGQIFLEGGIFQEKQITAIYEQEGFTLVEILKDYGGINRCIILKK